MINKTEATVPRAFQITTAMSPYMTRRNTPVESPAIPPASDVSEIRSLNLDNEAQQPFSMVKETLNTDHSESLSAHQGLDVNRVMSLLDGL